MKKIFNVHNILLMLVVALLSVLSLKITEVKAAGTVTWPDGSTATISRTVENVYNAPVVDFTYSVSTNDTSLLKTADFDTGPNVHDKIEAMVGSQEAHAFKKASSLLNGFTPTTANTISTSTSSYPIYMWFDSADGTIYYYTEANVIFLNSNSSDLLYNLWIADISGLAYVDASKVTNMNRILADNYITNVDVLSNWNTSNVLSMKYMIAECSELVDISGLSSWNTSKVTDMEGTLSACFALEDITALSNWDASKVTTMEAMFSDTAVTNLNALSSWDVSRVTNMSQTFAYCSSLTNINGISNWNTSVVDNIIGMFDSSSKASGTIQILGDPTDYYNVFNEAATASGAQITVNYGANTLSIDSIIAEKSAGSHIVKGQQVSPPSGGNSQSGGSSSSSSGTVFYTQNISFNGSETVSNSYTVNKSTTMDFSNMGLNLKKPGNYELIVKETATSNSAYPVDNDNEYTIVIQVTNVTSQDGTPTGNFNAKFVIKDDNDTKVSNMPFNEPKDETKFGHIELSKTVKGIMADRTKDFSFSVQVDDAASSACQSYSLGEKYLIKGTGVPEDGSEVTKCKSGTKDSITLNHGETATIGQFTYNNNTYESISIDDYYKIIEGTESNYTTTFKINSGSESSGNDTGSNSITHNGNVVNFYNQREGSPVTGLFLTILPYLILIGLGVIGIVLYRKDWSQLPIKIRDK